MSADLHHLASAYALDALDAEERQAFEGHYPSCEICRSDVAEHRELAADLAGAVQVPPPDALRTRVLAEIGQTRQIPPIVPDKVVDLAARRRPRTNLLLGAVAAAFVLLAGVVALRGPDAGGSRDLVALLAADDVNIAPLQADGVDGAISVAWSETSDQVAVLGSALGDPGEGLVYALWMLDAEGATPSLLFRPDGDGGLVEAIGDLPGDPSGWGITVEPRAGSPQPTGDIIFLAEV